MLCSTGGVQYVVCYGVTSGACVLVAVADMAAPRCAAVELGVA